MSKVSKIVFLIGSRSNTAVGFGKKVNDYISAFNDIQTESVDIDNLSIQEVEELFKSRNRSHFVPLLSLRVGLYQLNN